jgi:GAF domain-containing protein
MCIAMEPARARSPASTGSSRASAISALLRPAGSEREALLRVAAAAAGAQDLDDVLEVAAEQARAATGAASLSVSRWEREQGALRTVINVGDLGPGEERYPSGEVYPLKRTPPPSGCCGTAWPTSTRSTTRRSIRSAPRACAGSARSPRWAVPIVVEGSAWGEVYATTAPGQPRFRSTDVRFLEAVAGQVAVAIGRAELFSRVSRLAYEDPLTGLANRRALEDHLDRAVQGLAERFEGELAGEGPLERVEAMAIELAQALNAAADPGRHRRLRGARRRRLRRPCRARRARARRARQRAGGGGGRPRLDLAARALR